uniref:Uncharacterized protein n=1 Tax=Zooxanthella nutricula TaxID=1333877 RepID=A0A7S2HD77_9DINO
MAKGLVGPGTVTGRHLRVRFGPLEEHLWSAGAEPSRGASLLKQLKRGPCCWSMFISCAGFALPAMLHFGIWQNALDLVAGAALLFVAVTSTLCDAFCVDSSVFDDGFAGADGDRKYVQTAAAVGLRPDEVLRRIEEAGALPEVFANDRWNNLTRLVDRATCAFVVAPSLLVFALSQRPVWGFNLVLFGGFFIAWVICLVDQRYRYRDPCGVRYVHGRYAIERDYEIHQRLHEVWHFILIVVFCANAVYRPS